MLCVTVYSEIKSTIDCDVDSDPPIKPIDIFETSVKAFEHAAWPSAENTSKGVKALSSEAVCVTNKGSDLSSRCEALTRALHNMDL